MDGERDIHIHMDGWIVGPMFASNLLYIPIPKNIRGVRGEWALSVSVVKGYHLHCALLDVYDFGIEFWAQVDHPIV